jgi:peptide/nickel transport system substrate-binding protein
MKYVRILMVMAMLATSLLAVAPVAAQEPAGTYKVVAGDTLFVIALNHLGDGSRYLEIVEQTNKLNATDDTYAFIENPDLIEIGWVLALPEASTATVVAEKVISDTIAAGADPLGNMKSISKINDYTIVFEFYEPQPALPAQLATPQLSIHSPTAIKKLGKDYMYNPVGTGAYVFKEWIPDDKITLEANPNWWGATKPSIKTLVYRVISEPTARLLELQAGTVDFAYNLNIDDIPTAEADPNLVTHALPPLSIGYVSMNQDWLSAAGDKPFSKLQVRQAVAHAINKQAIVDALYPGTGIAAKSFMPPALWGFNDAVVDYAYDVAKAKALLTQAGYPTGFKTNLWVMPVSRGYYPDPPKVGEAIQADLKAAGIDATIVSYDWGTYLQKARLGEPAMAMLGWMPDFPDPDNYLFTFFSGATKLWAAGPPDAQLYKTLDDANGTMDLSERERLYKEANQRIHDVVPGIPMVHNGAVFASHKGLTGYSASPLFDYWFPASYSKDTLIIARNGDSVGLDVADETDGESMYIASQVFDSLLVFEPGTTRVRPALATSFSANADGTRWTFVLRQGVKFHDGTDFNADAVLYNFDSIWDPTHLDRAGHTGSYEYWSYFFGGFKGEVNE